MNIQRTLTDMGFITQHNGGGTRVMVWRGKTHTWVASGLDGDMPADDWWLVCEYVNENWDNGEDCERAFDSESDYFSDVIAAMLAD